LPRTPRLVYQMNSKQNGEAEDEIMQQYPSPTADGQDTGPFYNTNSREGQPQPDSPQEQSSRPPTDVESLQLVAQLGQSVAESPMIPATDPNMTVEDPNLRNIMPHPEPPPTHQYVPEPQPTDQLQQHVPVTMEQQIAHQYALGGDPNTPPRKRSKVSRACDECRRKKVKCDAQTDSGDAPCSNCKRSAIRCLFSRVPQKRGPSKG
jgi:hypothetical protein